MFNKSGHNIFPLFSETSIGFMKIADCMATETSYATSNYLVY